MYNPPVTHATDINTPLQRMFTW